MEEKREFRRKYWPSIREFAAGSFAGVGLIAAGQPFDTIKVRLQTEGSFGRFRGPLHCLFTTLKEERVFGLYKGALGPLLGQGSISAIQFSLLVTFLPFVQRFTRPLDLSIERGKENATLKELWIAGLLTGSLMFIPVTPIEGVKARLQVQYSESSTGVKAKYTGTFDAYKKIINESGIRGLYRGALPTFITRLSFSWYIWGYELSRRYLSPYCSSSYSMTMLCTMVSGGVAGTCFWLSNYPFDVIKNRIQADASNPPLYSSTSHCARVIYQKEGWRGFTRGLSVCLIRSLPANATTFLFLEIARNLLPT